MNKTYLVHHGILGQKWGVRRFQNPDGTWKTAGLKRHAKQVLESAKGKAKETVNNTKVKAKELKDTAKGLTKEQVKAKAKELGETAKDKAENFRLTEGQKTALKVGAAVVGTALAAYGTYKLSQYIQINRDNNALAKANDFLQNRWMDVVEQTTYKDGSKDITFRNKIGESYGTGKTNSKGVLRAKEYVDKWNADTMNKANDIYRNERNTGLDKAVDAVVGAGDTLSELLRKKQK